MAVESLVRSDASRVEMCEYLFTRWHQVLVGFEDVGESFFDVLLFHA